MIIINRHFKTKKITENCHQGAFGDANNDALSKHLNCSSASDECRSQAGRVFHEVGPDEQNARGPMEAVSDQSIHPSRKRTIRYEKFFCHKTRLLRKV